MAATQAFATNIYDGRYMRLELEETDINTIDNTSKINWKLSSKGGNVNFYDTGPTDIVINGETVYHSDRVYYTTPSETSFPAAKGYVSGTTSKIQHSSDGSKTVTVSFTTAIYTMVLDEFGGEMTLTEIDRAEPYIATAKSNIKANSFTITARTFVQCEDWQYSIDDGSWVSFGSSAGLSAKVDVSELKPNTTYSFKVRAKKVSNHVYGTSEENSVKTLGGSVLNSVSTMTVDNTSVSLSLNATVYDKNFTHTISIKNGSSTILELKNISMSQGTVNKSISLTPEQRTIILNAMSTVQSFSATYVLKTYNGSTQIGTESTTRATIQTTYENSAPIFTDFTFQDINPVTVALTENDQLMIQTMSTLEIVCTEAIANNGASIKKYRANISASLKESTTTTISYGAVASYGDLTLTVSAVDSRGYETSVSKQIIVIQYEKPSINEWSIRRINDVEDMTSLAFTGSYSPITINDINKNSVQSLTYKYRIINSGQPFSDPVEISGISYTTSYFDYENSSFAEFDSEYTYTIVLTVTDLLSYSESTLTLQVGKPLVSYRSKRVGINTNNPQSALDVDGDIRMNGYNIMGYCGESTNLNSLFEPGIYKVTSSTIGRPQNKTGFVEVLPKSGVYTVQRLVSIDNISADMYIRRITSSAQGSWYHITATEVT